MFWESFIKTARLNKRKLILAIQDMPRIPDEWKGSAYAKAKERKKEASGLYHAAELAGLGTLALPSIQHMRKKPMKDSTMHKLELLGLGILAAPSIAPAFSALAKKFVKR